MLYTDPVLVLARIRHKLPDEPGASEASLPAVRLPGGQVEVAGVQWRGDPGQIQRGMVENEVRLTKRELNLSTKCI